MAATMRLAEWTTLRIHLIWAYRGAPSYQHHKAAENSSLIAWLIEKGTVEVQGEHSGTFRAHAGQWVFPASDKVRHDFSDNASLVSIRFRAHWRNNTPLFSNERTVICGAAHHPRLKTASEQLIRAASGSPARRTDSTVRLLQHSIRLGTYLHLERAMLVWVEAYAHAMSQLGVSLTPVGHQDARVTLVLQAIEDMPMHERLDEHTVARSVGLSPSQLNRLFVASMGMTARAFAEKRRIDFARETLLGSALPIKELAYMLGFHQPSHFSAWFRKKLGMYPVAYRSLENIDVTRALG